MRILRFFFFACALLITPTLASATTKYWVGTGTGAFNVPGNWSIYSGSGSTTTVPGAGDVAVYNGGNTTNANVTASATGSSIEIRGGYTGRITLSSNITLALNTVIIGSSSATLRMGTGSKLLLRGAGTPLSGTGTLDVMTNKPNTVEYTAPGTTNLLGTTYHHLTVDPPGFQRTDALALPSLQNNYIGVVDATNGFVYIGSDNSVHAKVRLSDLTQVATVTTANNRTRSAVVDAANGFVYFGNDGTPTRISKVRISDWTEVGALTLNTDETCANHAVIDPANGFAYFGTIQTCPGGGTSTGVIVKVKLSDFTRVGAIKLNAGENFYRYSSTATIDTANGFAYFMIYSSPGKVVKIRLSDFTRVATLTLSSGEDNPVSAGIDTTNGFLYVGTGTSPGILVKIRLSDFTRVGALTLSSGENLPYNLMTVDATNGFLYVGTLTDPSRIVKIRLSDFTRVGAVTLNAGEIDHMASGLDSSLSYLYVLDLVTPTHVVRLNLGSTSSALGRLGSAANQTLTVNGNLTIGNGTNITALTAAVNNPTITVAGSLLINASGSLVASSSSALRVAGHWTNSGIFTHNAGTVTLNGTNQTLSGSSTFFTLTKNVTSAYTLSIDPNSIVGATTLNLRGTSSAMLMLRSSIAGSIWRVSPTVANVNYADVKDSRNTALALIYCYDCTNNGNNSQWEFATSPTVSTITTTGGGGGDTGRRGSAVAAPPSAPAATPAAVTAPVKPTVAAPSPAKAPKKRADALQQAIDKTKNVKAKQRLQKALDRLKKTIGGKAKR